MRSCEIFLVAILFCKLIALCPAQKVYAAGRGLMAESPESAAEVIALAGGNTASQPKNLLYLGTAVYDNPRSAETDTANYAALGCSISALNVSWIAPSADEIDGAFADIDIILIAGGNTLFAVDRWKKLGIDERIREAVLERDVVVAGGSAGFISLCSGGHSDSMKPESYKYPVGPLLNPNAKVREAIDRSWEYIRVPGLNIIEGALCCPHYDTIQNNNVSRADDFSNMMRRHSGEHGIAVDEWAALVIDGPSYKVVSRANHTGSVGPNGEFVSGSSGLPGIWTLSVDSNNGDVERKLVPPTGRVQDILHPPKWIVEDPMVLIARAQNPDDGRPAAWVEGGNQYRPYHFAIVLAFGALVGAIVSLYWRIKRLPVNAYEQLSFVDVNDNDSCDDPEEGE